MTTSASAETSDPRSTLARRTAFATLGVLLSRFSGIFRSQVVNAVYGASTRLDAFNVALRFPSVLRDLFAEGALSAAFTKEVVAAERQGNEELRRLVSVVCGFFLCVTGFISLLGWYYARPIVGSVSSDSFRQRGGFELAVGCFQILVFYLPIAMISALAMSLLGVRGQTFRALIASAFFNVGTIAGAAVGGLFATAWSFEPIKGLAYGTLAGGFFQFLYQVTPLVRAGLFPCPNLSPRAWILYPPLRSMLMMMAPRALSQGALSLALFVNTHFATAAGEGAITFITNAQVIILVPVGLFGVAAGFASLPVLSQAVQERNAEKMSVLMADSLQNAFWMSWLSLFAFALMGVPFCVVLLEHGRVTPLDSVQNAVAVSAYSIGMLFNSGSKILMQGFYALNDVRRSVINALIYLLINATLSALLAPRFGILGLGLSNSLSAAADFTLNWIFLRRVAARSDLHLQALHGHQGQKLRFQILLLAISAFVVGLSGVFAARSWWMPDSWFWHVLNVHRLPTAAFWLAILGVLWGLTAVLLIYFFGPDILKTHLLRVKRKLLRVVP